MVPGYVDFREGGISERGGRSGWEDGGFFTRTGQFVVQEGVFCCEQVCGVPRVRELVRHQEGFNGLWCLSSSFSVFVIVCLLSFLRGYQRQRARERRRRTFGLDDVSNTFCFLFGLSPVETGLGAVEEDRVARWLGLRRAGASCGLL